ncbi:MAG: DUF3413 domain-containing protein, partial [Fibrobacter sp.]|nr:DUF3413 domain-containing protein [Fibrobacter sp.]
MENKVSDKKNSSKVRFWKNWLKLKNRIDLLRWSGGFFSALTLFLLLIGLFYIFGYHFPTSPLAVFYTFAAFFSHFGSISLSLWVAVVIPLTLLLPYKRFIIPFSIFLASIALCIELLDAQLFSSRHFHLGMLTIRILGWRTWGFGIIYAFIFLMFNSLIAKITWERFVIAHKKIYLWVSIPAILLLLAFTHAAHVWADATGYIDITRFTTRLPLFYPSTGKHFMVQHGFADISERRNFPKKFDNIGKDLFYPQRPLEFSSDAKLSNIVVIAVDAMRADMVNSRNFGKTLKFAQEHGTIFNNHYSGGNSSKMGLFTFFYGIPPTYQQYAELNKRSPLLIDKMQESGYNMGIFTSYRLYTPANLDITVFLK